MNVIKKPRPMSGESYRIPNCYFKLVFTEKHFYQDIYCDYTCKELYEKILPNVNRFIVEGDNTEINKIEIVPIRNTENGLALTQIDVPLRDLIHKDDLNCFYIRLL